MERSGKWPWGIETGLSPEREEVSLPKVVVWGGAHGKTLLGKFSDGKERSVSKGLDKSSAA